MKKLFYGFILSLLLFSYADAQIATDQIYGGVYTKAEVDGTIENAIAAIPETDLSNYYNKSQTESTVAVMINDNAQAKYWYANNMVSGDFTGEVLIATVASSQTQYYAVYMSSSGLAAADADAYTTLPALGVILETGTGDKKVLVKGLVRNDSWNWTVGGRVYVSESAGQLTQTAPSTVGKMVNIVGIAVHADILYVCPSTTVVEN